MCFVDIIEPKGVIILNSIVGAPEKWFKWQLFTKKSLLPDKKKGASAKILRNFLDILIWK